MEVRILESIVSIIFFSNKIGLLVERKNPLGWWLGVIGAVSAIFYFFLINLPIYTVAEVGLLVLMIYGTKEKRSRKTEIGIEIATGFIAVALVFLTFQGEITMFEFLSSIGMLVALYLLHPSNGGWKMKWGWVILAVTHVLAAQIGYMKEQPMFPHYQIASAIVGIFGAIKKD